GRAAPAGTSETATATKDAVVPAPATNPAAASEQAAAPDPLAALDPADRAVAEKIRDLLAAKTDTIFANKRERAVVDAFYQARHLAPLWLDKGVQNARAQAVIARLKDADADGLDVNDYKTPTFARLSPDAPAEAELKLTHTVLPYDRPPGARPLRLHPRQQQYRVATRAAGSGCDPRQDRQFRQRRHGARRLQPATRGLQEAQGHARADARQDCRCQRDRRRPAAQAQCQGPDGGSARSAAAGQARARRRYVRPQIRRQARRGGEEIPARQRAAGHRQSRFEDPQGAQRSAARQADRHGHLQHGALALVSARS